jgi:hypothetical protein
VRALLADEDTSPQWPSSVSDAGTLQWVTSLESIDAKTVDQFFKEDASLVAGLELDDPLPGRTVLRRERAMLLKDALTRSTNLSDDGHTAFVEYMVRAHTPRAKDSGYKRFAKMWKTVVDPQGRARPLSPLVEEVEEDVLHHGVEHPNYFRTLDTLRCLQQQKDIVPYVSKHDLHY